MSKKTKILFLCFLLGSLGIYAALLYCGFVHLNHPDRKHYPVRGVDVSSYQGVIDWNMLSSQGIDFAFIKATEGADYIDDRFAENLASAMDTDLKVGAYHFFTVLSSGKAQAENFSRTVPKNANMLPPVVDLEVTAALSLTSVEEFRCELRDFLETVKEYYGRNPIIYTTKDSYAELISGAFDDYDIWYRSVYSPAPKSVDWTFWQYSNRHRLEGYSGKERYIDMNIFSGSRDEWIAYCAGN